MIVFKLILLNLFITVSKCRVPDKVYCANKECDGPVSKAKTLLSYTSIDPDLISFPANREATVYMKSAGTNSELWFVNISGKSGFVNSRFLREYKILEKNLEVVPFEAKKPETVVKPAKVQQAHEVVEGTTIYTTEAAVNNAQQDSSSESPGIASPNEDLTPLLNRASNAPNKKEENNVPSQDTTTTSEASVNDEPNSNEILNSQNNEEPLPMISPLPEILPKAEAIVVSDNVHQNEESSIEKAEATDDVGNNSNTAQNEPEEVIDTAQELPRDILPEIKSPQQIVTTGSSTGNTETILELPEKQDYLQNTLTESEQGDIKEQNTSSPNNNIENMQVSQETSTEINDALNGNSINDHVSNTGEEHPESSTNTPDLTPHTVSEPSVNPISEPVVSLTVEPPINEPSEKVPAESGTVGSINQVIPPIFNNINTNNEHGSIPNVNSLESKQNTAPPAEPTLSPPTETLPPIETIPTTQTETIPPFHSEAVPTPETIPPIISMEAPPTTEFPTQKVPPLHTDTTAPEPYSPDETNNDKTTERMPTEDNPSSVEEIISALPDYSEGATETSTETIVQDESTEGFFSNMYSTVADMWPSSTESPKPLYNSEYPTYESQKADGDEGFSFIKYIMSTYYSIMGTSEESRALFASVGETCFTNEYCDGTSNDGSNRLLTFLLTAASSILLFTLGYYYIDNRRQDGRLIGTINSLQRDLLFTTKLEVLNQQLVEAKNTIELQKHEIEALKECEILKEELATTKNKLAGIEDSSFGMDDMVQSLKEEINELKATNDRLRNSLDDNEKLLRVSENTAGELQNTLSEVENTLSELLAERANSEEQIVELNGKIQAFEEELISVSRERDNFQLKYVSAETALEEFKKQKKQLEVLNQQLVEAKNTIELQKHEIEALKDAIKELKSGMSADVDVTSFIDHTEIKAKLAKALQEKKTFETKFETEHKERTRLAEELKANQETLTVTSQNATEALTRLEVLGKYFQERESELLKELSAKESLWLSKQGESASTVEKIESLQQEVQRYKEKCDALTLELAEQESSRRTALSEVETRAHGAWLEARAAKREADAARDEAAALRRKLASLSAADGAVSPHHKVSSPLDNVENAVIPPPLPPMFLPPPPLLPPLPRPPPLGRLPSPHPPRYGERRYSPDSRYSPESRYSPDSRYSPETVRYSPDSRYSPRSRRSPYSPRSRRRSRSRDRYEENRSTRSRNGPAPPPDTETEYNSDSPSRLPRRRSRYSRHSGPSSGSGCSSESDK